MERTFACIFASDRPNSYSDLRLQLEREGFTVVAEESISGEELEEAGIDLGLGVGEAGDDSDGKETMHTALVVEKEDAVKSIIAISKE